ncbi:MAG: bifunctional lysine ketoglutarate reductase /saccharopine dehydrogenase family protein [Candidatus Heimdallarchaeota archaeon]
MANIIGIRREDKNKWERRTPIVPNDAKTLIGEHNLDFIIQSSTIRAYTDEDYGGIGARVSTAIDEANVIFAIKEIPISLLKPKKTYIFFSHTIKGQKGNMPMLQHILDTNATLIDYEKIVDERGFRLIYFGNYAGYAGMIETLWGFGQRIKTKKGIETPFLKLRHTYEYGGLEAAKKAVSKIGNEIKEEGIDADLVPLVIGFAGYGNVSQGAQAILDLFPVIEIQPIDLQDFFSSGDFSSNHLYKVVFKEEHMVMPRGDFAFDLQDYYDHGSEKYQGMFHEYFQYLSIMINGIYWSNKYPRLLTKSFLRDVFSSKRDIKLQVIGDISCDIEGGIEATVKTTKPDNPFFVYNPVSGEAKLGLDGDGIPIMAVDNLPCELPHESSTNFSKTLKPFIPIISSADYTKPFDTLDLPPVIKDAVIAHQGHLTPRYAYLEENLSQAK